MTTGAPLNLVKTVDGDNARTALNTDIPANFQAINDAFGASLARANLLVNGGFEINQRNATVTTTATYIHDRWLLTLGAASACTALDETAVIDAVGLHALKATYTHSAVSTISQKIEGYGELRGKTLSISMRVRSNAASSVRLRIDDSAGSGTAGSYHTGGSTYETLTATKTIGAAVTSVTVVVELNATAIVYLDNAMLCISPVPVDYVPLTPADEMARCQRYYEVQGGVIYSMYTAGYADNPAAGIGGWVSLVTKACIPTLTKTGTWTVANCAQPNPWGATTTGYILTAQSSGSARVSFYCDTADDLIIAEANP